MTTADPRRPRPPGRIGSARTGPSPAVVRRWRRRLADERAEGNVYRYLASRRSGEEREILLGLAEAEDRHAAHWRRLLGDQVGPPQSGGWQTRLLGLLARRLGSVFVLALAQRLEGRSPYAADADATAAMAADERVHAEVVRGLASRGRAGVSGTFRAAVFGANDGLVSNLALVLGVSGGGAATRTIMLTGLVGLLSGALSMGAGEYISVGSQRELLAASMPDPSAGAVFGQLDVNANELALVYRARGMSAPEAQQRADAMLRTHSAVLEPDGTVEEDRHGIVGTGVKAAVSSFAFFASGAAVPVLPYMVGVHGTAALDAAIVLVGLFLMVTGATVGLLSGGPPLRRALRQLAIGAGAATVTYLLGLVFEAIMG